MATTNNSALEQLRQWHRVEEHPIWLQNFPESEQQHMLQDDLDASHSVTTVLVTVVTIGFLLISGTVLLTSL